MIERLERIGRLAENAALVVLLGGMVLLAFGQIVLREVFETGFFWADELLKLMVLWLAMIGSIAATRDDRHIRIDVLSHILSKRATAVTRVVVDAFSAVVCAVIAWQAWRYLQLEIEFEDTVLIELPAWIAHIVLPLSFAVMSYRFAVLVLKRTLEIVAGSGADEAP